MRLAALLLLAASCSAMARLGETAAQIQSRYGEPEAVLSRHPDGSAKVARFRFNGYVVEVVFNGGFSVREAYAKPVGVFTEQEAVSLLSNNSNGSIWIMLDMGRRYQRQDLTAYAGGVGQNVFYIEYAAKRVVGPMVGF